MNRMTANPRLAHWIAATAFVGLAVAACAGLPTAPSHVRDPGVRNTPPPGGAPTPLSDLTADELLFFQDGLQLFKVTEVVTGGSESNNTSNGLGPRFNSNQCASCHLQPTVGGSSPALNPLVAIATQHGARNKMPWFITANGPIREARFVQSNGTKDGSVHNLFVVTGRDDAHGCQLDQPDFGPAGNALSGRGGNPNIVFRTPTPVFGAGLIEAIPDAAILANLRSEESAKAGMGIHGRPNAHLSGNVNLSGNDGTITRFGWKAQNKSLLMFAGEAYNVEMGVSNQLFPQERDETPGCNGFSPTPEDTLNFPSARTSPAATSVISDIEAFSNFMRLLAPPAPAPATPSTKNGLSKFLSIGCAFCHTPAMKTGARIASGSATNPSVALSNRQVSLWSDLLLHHMGAGLADGVTQGAAGPDEFRSSPLWGVGQRIFFLHDGRTSDIVEAIEAHRGNGSEANKVIEDFNRLGVKDQQDLVNFLRSL